MSQIKSSVVVVVIKKAVFNLWPFIFQLELSRMIDRVFLKPFYS